MNKEKKWKILAIVSSALLIIVLCTSASYGYGNDISDICKYLSNIDSSLGSINSSLSKMNIYLSDLSYLSYLSDLSDLSYLSDIESELNDIKWNM